MMKPRLLDLFCCAGGAAEGYQIAGFDVTGVDIAAQPRYRGGRFIRADVMGLDLEFLSSFDAIHASPPCQGYSAMRHAPGAKHHDRLIGAVRERLELTGLPWIIENVEEARSEMPGATMLCGSMFRLGAAGFQLQRHRLFISNVEISAPCPCQHSAAGVVGIYGGHARVRSAKHGGRTTRDVWPNGHRPIAEEAMGMDWATLAEMSEAIPPAYCAHLGAQLLQHLQNSSAQLAA